MMIDLKPRDVVRWTKDPQPDRRLRIVSVSARADVAVLAYAVDDPQCMYVLDRPEHFELIRRGRMSEARAGDVVHTDGDRSNARPWGCETFRDVREGSTSQTLVVGGAGWPRQEVRKSELFALFRPMRAGDRLRYYHSRLRITNEDRYAAVTLAYPTGDTRIAYVVFDDRREHLQVMSELADWDRWEHEDGTPILPPPLRATPGNARHHSAPAKPAPACQTGLAPETIEAYIRKNIEPGQTPDRFLLDAIGLERLERAIHATDPEVVVVAVQRSEARYEPEKPSEEEGRAPALRRAFEVAFERDEPKGSRARAHARMHDILEALPHIKTKPKEDPTP
jgi:hypothetical protein